MEAQNRIWTTFRKKPMALVGMGMLAVALIMAFFAPLLAPYDPNERVDVTPADILAPPGEGHLLGRDDAGKRATRPPRRRTGCRRDPCGPTSRW